MARAAAACDKALKLEEQHSMQKWEELKQILYDCGYPVKIDNGNELYLSIKGEDNADIEIFRSINGDIFVYIQLWHYHFAVEGVNFERVHGSKNHYASLVDAVSYINKIYEAVRLDQKAK